MPEQNDELEMLGRAAFAAIMAAGCDTDNAKNWQEYFRPMSPVLNIDKENNGLDFWANHVAKEITDLDNEWAKEVEELEERIDNLETEIDELKGLG
ncbi:hypothetical protein SEA_GIBBLES_92 [Gordonia phage Gibbles]|nr:hypothetical protein SEA_GIBBLES_92 [Gordonia phage Gibbles]